MVEGCPCVVCGGCFCLLACLCGVVDDGDMVALSKCCSWFDVDDCLGVNTWLFSWCLITIYYIGSFNHAKNKCLFSIVKHQLTVFGITIDSIGSFNQSQGSMVSVLVLERTYHNSLARAELVVCDFN